MPSANTAIYPLSYQHSPQGDSVGGVTFQALAQQFGTPLYILDGATVRSMAQAYLAPLNTYPGTALPLYACKANCTIGLLWLLTQMGLGLDIVSGGELLTAVQAKAPMTRVFFNGNNKSPEEIRFGVHHGIERFTVDNAHELGLIHQAVLEQGKGPVPVLLRITPGIDCHTHAYIRTGHTDSKFGFDLATLDHAVADIVAGPYAQTLRLSGLHAHVGSQIFETEPYLELVRVMFGWYQRIREQTGGLVLPDMNLGGGLGIAYTANDDPPDVGQTLASVLAEVQREAARLAYPLPRLLFEPGRSMVATAGVTLYTVGSFKDVSPSAARPEGRRYVAVDGGMGDNIRPSLYQAGYTAKIVTPGRSTAQRAVALAGKYCESGDVLIPALDLPEDVAPGDHLVVFGTGAYNYVMASNYNRVPRPAMVWVENGQAQVLVRRETWEDLLQYDQMPQVVREV